MVQKDQVIVVFLNQLQAFPAPFRLRHLDLGFFQQVPQHSAIDGVVIHHQKLCLRGKKLTAIAVIVCKLVDSGLKISNGSGIDNILFQLKIEPGAFAIGTFYLQAASQKFQQLDGDVHAQAGALNVAVAVFFNALKFCR